MKRTHPNVFTGLGVIEKVDQPTEWCSPVAVILKKNGKVRICGDVTQLNKAVLRENHPMLTTEQTLTLAKLAGAKIVSKLDANCRFWLSKLSLSSRLLTTFITPGDVTVIGGYPSQYLQHLNTSRR